MNDPLPYRAPTPPDPSRQSAWGVASFACSCLVAASLAAAAVVGAFGDPAARRDGRDMSGVLLGLVGVWALAVLLGIVSLLQYERKQLFASWCLVLAAVTGPLLLITAALVWGRFD